MLSLIKKAKECKGSIIFTVLTVVSLYIIMVNNGSRYSYTLSVIFGLISISSLYGIFLSVDKSSYSVNKTYHIFTYFFFSIAPALQFKTESSLLEAPILSFNQYLRTALLILFVQILYLVLYTKLYKSSKLLIKAKANQSFFVSSKLLIAVALISLAVFLYLVDFDPNVIFKRPENHWQKSHTKHGLIGYSILLVVRSIPVICVLIFELATTGSKKNKYRFALLILTLLASFPTSLTRATLAYYYLPLLIIYIPSFKKAYFFVGSMFFSMFALFPALNLLRPSGVTEFGFKQFITPHFDAFHNLAFLLSENIITYGNQLLGAVLFFVPNSSWENKPVGTGQLVAEQLNFVYTNVSMPFWGEGYSNFGYLGVLLFLIVIVILNVFFDKNYNKRNLNLKLKISYLFLLGFEFYLLRGDLYSSIKLSGSYFIALFFVIFLININKKSTLKI